VAHDVKELASISAELAEQQAAVQQQLAASQELAEAMRQQAALHNCSMDEVVGHFFNVYNIACFVATDRERCATKQKNGRKNGRGCTMHVIRTVFAVFCTVCVGLAFDIMRQALLLKPLHHFVMSLLVMPAVCLIS
jgi:hypothetical protein